jgi:hypothetical protein
MITVQICVINVQIWIEPVHLFHRLATAPRVSIIRRFRFSEKNFSSLKTYMLDILLWCRFGHV